MANLFRCPINTEEREYILKAGGIVQKGYVANFYKRYSMDSGGEASTSNNSVYLLGNGTVVTYYDFDATQWDKLHIKQAKGYNWGGTKNIIAVCTQTSYYEMFERNMVRTIRNPSGNPQDYVFDISNLSGIHTFCLFLELVDGLMTNTLSLTINGDLYLSR